jgi:hypothetical protein
MYSKSNEFQIIENTDHKIVIKLDSNMYISVAIVPDVNNVSYHLYLSQ